MRKIKRGLLRALPFLLIAVLFITFFAMFSAPEASEKEREMLTLNLWQIDGFEGGKGSRAGYLSQIGAKYSEKTRCYVTVTSLTSDAARENLARGITPDLISYPAGMYGFESKITGERAYTTWCYGSYCILTLDEGGDFSDISTQNTVINGGKDNFSSAAAIFCGLGGAEVSPPTAAYVKLINGEYKYLLGTQRDIYRLITRGKTFAVLPVTQFNDLYQNISVTTEDDGKISAAQGFIDYLLSQSEGVVNLGLMYGGKTLHEGQMALLEGKTYDCKLACPISKQTRSSILNAIAANDINLIKNLVN